MNHDATKSSSNILVSLEKIYDVKSLEVKVTGM